MFTTVGEEFVAFERLFFHIHSVLSDSRMI